MNCENIYCVYWRDNECSLREISLDIQGSCKNCIYVNIPVNEIRKQREKQLKSYYE